MLCSWHPRGYFYGPGPVKHANLLPCNLPVQVAPMANIANEITVYLLTTVVLDAREQTTYICTLIPVLFKMRLINQSCSVGYIKVRPTSVNRRRMLRLSPIRHFRTLAVASSKHKMCFRKTCHDCPLLYTQIDAEFCHSCPTIEKEQRDMRALQDQ